MRKRVPAVDVVGARRGAQLFRVALERPSGDPANPREDVVFRPAGRIR